MIFFGIPKVFQGQTCTNRCGRHWKTTFLLVGMKLSKMIIRSEKSSIGDGFRMELDGFRLRRGGYTFFFCSLVENHIADVSLLIVPDGSLTMDSRGHWQNMNSG